jgi:hypothetical protein
LTVQAGATFVPGGSVLSLAAAREEIEHLSAKVTSSAGQKQKATEDCEKVIHHRLLVVEREQ